ncbi:proline--tRNA ligase [Metamycoplasma phocicerebrale]|uniref:Proline--tRNA ligase n=1 Tax=Metamycoplasma phocicerebrale TaxID=142649 RepID=A0A3Q9V3E5_9BACT|nr:proline--tRNA ligase [Metamycoplasma phocicerebrale]AZZ65707.1 proline--tRNA ligase [Metamycoplasma phocicerebrale]
MKKLEKITTQEENFAKWYTDVIQNGDLMAYGSSKGSIIFKPLSFGIWDNIRKNLDVKFKKLGVQNVNLPLLIPESLLNKEKKHVEGFNPELATVTEVGGKKLNEKFYIRPTSEVLFGEFFKNEIESYNDLPLIYNQWVNVLRWEKTTNPFLRTREFLWQEGHTIHATSNEAKELTQNLLDVYSDFVESFLAIPVIKGQKTDHEKFAGADYTFTIEAMMKDGKALQAGTSHYLGQNFTKAFDITFKNKDNKLENAYGTSWGVSTRLLGALIMTHGDDRGIIIPPKIAPCQVDIIELFASKEKRVHEEALKILDLLSKNNIDAKIDASNKGAGFKAANSEIHGTPLRIEIGPRDLEQNKVLIVRRDTLEKTYVALEEIVIKVQQILEDIQNNLLNQAKQRLINNIFEVENYESFKEHISKGHWVITKFDGNGEDEDKIKEETGASSRCIPFNLEYKMHSKNCFYTNKKTNRVVIFAKAY